VAEVQRRRLLLGVAHAVARNGYAATTVADILAEVRISRRTFYEMFRDKEDCYLAAYEVAHQAMIDTIRESQRGIADALVRTERAHHAFLAFICQHADFAAAFLVGIVEAGPQAAQRRQQSNQEFAEMHLVLHRQLRRQHPRLPQVPKKAFFALSSGANLLVVDELRQRGRGKLMELLPTILYLSYSIYGLYGEAARVLKAGRRFRVR
jgi:AcrR family transcriptional regulator